MVSNGVVEQRFWVRAVHLACGCVAIRRLRNRMPSGNHMPYATAWHHPPPINKCCQNNVTRSLFFYMIFIYLFGKMNRSSIQKTSPHQCIGETMRNPQIIIRFRSNLYMHKQYLYCRVPLNAIST